MRVPRVRFTVRRLMVVVAVVGIAAGVVSLSVRYESDRRVSYYQALASKHAGRERDYLDEIRLIDDEARRSAVLRSNPAYVAHWRRWYQLSAAHHAQLKVKYGRAALHPWRPVSPDPPMPQGYPPPRPAP